MKWLKATLALVFLFIGCGRGFSDGPIAGLHHHTSNADCMKHDPHWSVVVTYWADTTMTRVARADTTCSITGPVQGGITIGGGSGPANVFTRR